MDIDTLRKRIVYQIPGMEAVDVRRDLVYLEDGGTALHMEVYTPPGLPDDARLPAVLLVHGGPLRAELPLQPKDWGVFQSYGELLAANLPLDLLNHPRGQHGFDTLDDDDRSRETIAHTLAFVQTHLQR